MYVFGYKVEENIVYKYLVDERSWEIVNMLEMV